VARKRYSKRQRGCTSTGAVDILKHLCTKPVILAVSASGVKHCCISHADWMLMSYIDHCRMEFSGQEGSKGHTLLLREDKMTGKLKKKN